MNNNRTQVNIKKNQKESKSHPKSKFEFSINLCTLVARNLIVSF